jgi:hypothetical protein
VTSEPRYTPRAREAAYQSCPCIAYDPESDEDYAPCACGHSAEEHANGPCEGEALDDHDDYETGWLNDAHS